MEKTTQNRFHFTWNAFHFQKHVPCTVPKSIVVAVVVVSHLKMHAVDYMWRLLATILLLFLLLFLLLIETWKISRNTLNEVHICEIDRSNIEFLSVNFLLEIVYQAWSTKSELKMTVSEFSAENTIPKGKYTYVGVDIDTTGRRILDEVRISIYYGQKISFFNSTRLFSPTKPRAMIGADDLFTLTFSFRSSSSFHIRLAAIRLSIWPHTLQTSSSTNMSFRWWI